MPKHIQSSDAAKSKAKAKSKTKTKNNSGSKSIPKNKSKRKNEPSEEPESNNEETQSERSEGSEEASEESEEKVIDEKTRRRLQKKIGEWLDFDDKIKELNNRSKKYKDAKKQHEDDIIKTITKLKLSDNKFDITDDDGQIRSRVYKHKSEVKEALKDDLIKETLMEICKDENKVDQLIIKMHDKRQPKTRFYLKRTKGNN